LLIYATICPLFLTSNILDFRSSWHPPSARRRRSEWCEWVRPGLIFYFFKHLVFFSFRKFCLILFSNSKISNLCIIPTSGVHTGSFSVGVRVCVCVCLCVWCVCFFRNNIKKIIVELIFFIFFPFFPFYFYFIKNV
jgi:hypothetical protein